MGQEVKPLKQDVIQFLYEAFTTIGLEITNDETSISLVTLVCTGKTIAEVTGEIQVGINNGYSFDFQKKLCIDYLKSIL